MGATVCVDMGRNMPQTDAPIATEIVEQIADEFDHDTDDVAMILDGVQMMFKEAFGYQRDHRVVAETDELLITLSEYHLRNETDEVAYEFDLDDELAHDAANIASRAHHEMFKSTEIKRIMGYSDQDATGALSTKYPRIIRKPEHEQPADNVEYRIQYERGYDRPYHFVARANATVDGEYGTLKIDRTYRAIPDGDSDADRDAITVVSETTHEESDTLVQDHVDEFSIDEQLRVTESPTAPPITEETPKLRNWIFENHTADFEFEYEQIEKTVPICDECGAYQSEHVHVEQRSTKQIDPSIPDTMCNHCHAELLAGLTMLSQQEAEVYALKESGVSHRQVEESLPNVSESQVSTVMGRVRSKKAKAAKEREQAQRTIDLVRDI